MIVQEVKARRLGKDPLLRCDVCGFSFVLSYGQMGEGFIEAHHKVPLGEIRGKTRTTANCFDLICANCHRMIHREKGLTARELKRRLRSPQRAMR